MRTIEPEIEDGPIVSRLQQNNGMHGERWGKDTVDGTVGYKASAMAHSPVALMVKVSSERT